MTKIVIDTNVVISAAFWGGRPQKIVDMVFKNDVEAIVSLGIIEEYRDVFSEIIQKYSEKQPNFSVDSIINASKLITPHTNIEICRDPDDNKFIECAVDGKCVYIVSGDDDLLAVGEYGGIKIMSVTQFFDIRESVKPEKLRIEI
jgi:putative PIN family toxin of toxin-antitoxin system